jgi:hypothetical protein
MIKKTPLYTPLKLFRNFFLERGGSMDFEEKKIPSGSLPYKYEYLSDDNHFLRPLDLAEKSL